MPTLAAPGPLRLTLEICTGACAGERRRVTLPCTIGRGPDAGLTLPDRHLSTDHGRLSVHEGAVRYVDRQSSNGSTHVRQGVSTALASECPVAEIWDQDELHLGDPEQPVVLRVHLENTEGAPQVVAVRPIEDVPRFAGRITAEPGRLSILYRYSAELGGSTSLETVLAVAARLVFELLPHATHFAVALKERAGRFPVVYARARDGERVQIPVSRTILQTVLTRRAGLLITNAAAEFADARSVSRAGIASTLCVPLWTGADIRGVMQVDNRAAPGLFGGEDLEVLTVAAGPVSFAAENARLVGQLQNAEQRLSRENAYLREHVEAQTFGGIIGESRAVQSVTASIERVRDTRVPVLIQGETGTGKELVARALHYTSARREKLFVAQNFSALPETLLESALFGHTRGAFTGADRDKKGLFELADGGTIFLDEIGETPPSLQAKLLRVLQEGEIWPLGASGPRRVDARVVSATHRDLEEMVRSGTFRQDLFYRLHVFPIRLPALRERREDIPLLALHFLARYALELGRPSAGFTPEALERLGQYDWPGNIRELQNELQRILIQRVEGDLILPEDLSPRVLGSTSLLDEAGAEHGSLKDMLGALERVLLMRALRQHDGNKTRTAQALGITREGLHKKLSRYGMDG